MIILMCRKGAWYAVVRRGKQGRIINANNTFRLLKVAMKAAFLLYEALYIMGAQLTLADLIQRISVRLVFGDNCR